ncbi:P-loop containing nucleoside triphosphate hydrolase protein [Myxozyma melibiosi]|uniref:Structural maintenance of chromosomes protein 5 n=1 Tax=Myxozyma melibiosi TaxID=54550 RepID=A0ABR1EYR1_9ASCO
MAFVRKQQSDEDTDFYHEEERGMKEVASKRRRVSLDPPDERVNNDGHAPGAIVRVALVDFVTYSNVVFWLGPSMNMIIGPNGTGKSTLVCAIALGLGGKPELLGRAKDIGEFVKQGKKRGTILIEIKGHAGEPNRTIERTIFSDNRSEWNIDGKHTTARAVKDLTDSFSIQIDNLCQFLPQDKVAEFAHMSPQLLLQETERATGSAEMLSQHQELIKLQNEYTALARSSSANEKELEKLVQVQERSREEVERFQQRAKLQERRKYLENILPAAVMQEAVSKGTEAKKEGRRLKAIKDELEARTGPSGELRDAAKTKLDEFRAEVERQKLAVSKAMKKLDAKISKKDEFNTQVEAKKSEIKSIGKEREKTKTKIQDLKKDISAARERLKNKPDEKTGEELQAKLKEARQKLRTVEEQRTKISDEANSFDQENKRATAEVEDLKKQLTSLNSVDVQRLARVEKIDKDTWEAIKWLRQNKNLFKEEIYEPPIMSLRVKDASLTYAVESVAKRNTLLTFTCMNREDYVLFNKHVQDENKLSVAVAEYSKSDRPRLESWGRLMDENKLKSLGFECVVSDLIEAPDAVMNMLYHTSSINMVAFSRRELSVAQVNKVDAAKRADGAPLIQKYISGRQSIYVKQSAYGSRELLKSNQKIGSPVALVSGGVDQAQKTRLMERLKEREQKRSETEERTKEKRAQMRKFNDMRKAVDAEKNTIQSALTEWQGLKRKYNSTEAKLDDLVFQLQELEQAPDSTAERIRERERELEEIAGQRERFAVELVEETRKVAKMQVGLVGRIVAEQKGKSDYEVLNERFEVANRELVEVQAAVQAQREITRELRQRAVQEKDRLMEHLASLSEEDHALVEEYMIDENRIDRSEIEAETERVDEQLNQIFSGNAHVLETYERRAREIAKLREKVEIGSGKVAELEARIREIRSGWERELDALVGRISDEFAEAFRSIGCAGTVGVGKDEEDYEKWRIDIKVRFRENEQLQLLTHQRQSGGERSVSTIFYLMALQCVTKAPFRVVDEINQGMDPRNERMVHRRMVEVACAENASQYFLITPKLLPDLTFHEKMSVHCIFSGGFLPERGGAADFGRLRKYVEVGKRLRERV